MTKATLINQPDRKTAINIMFTAAKTCSSPDYPEDIFETVNQKEPIGLSEENKIFFIRKVLNSGHLSIAEHITFTFALSKMSRCCSHQLVRHRHMTISQQSQRYVKKVPECVIPDAISSKQNISTEYLNTMESIYTVYDKLLEAGIKAEDARMILPGGSLTNMVVTLNVRELIHVCNLRLCSRAQWEVRSLVGKMCNEVLVQHDYLKPFLVPNCIKLGRCPEDNSCGFYKNDI